MVYAVTCWARFSHTLTAARSMSAAVQLLPPSSFFCVEFHRGRFLDPSCSCCIWRTCCGWSTNTNSVHICTPTTRKRLLPSISGIAAPGAGISVCVDEIALWMRSNRLQLYASKTEVFWCASSRRRHQMSQTLVRVCADFIQSASSVRDLGIYLNADASMRTHVSRTVSNYFAVLRQTQTRDGV